MEKGKIKIAILSFSALLMGASIVTGILAEIAKYYSEISMSIVSMVLTLPFLISTAFALFAGPLSKIVSKKNLVLFSLIIQLTAAALSFLFGGISIYVLLAASALFGIAQGLLSTLSMAVIADYFEGQERSSMMGLQSAAVNFGGMIISFIGALLAGIYWQYAYLVILVAIPSLIVVMIYLPKDKPVKKIDTSQDESGGGLNSTVFLNAFTVFFFGLFMFVFQSNVALYLDANHLGDATTAGMANTTLVAVGGITGILYGHIHKVLKKYLMPVGIMVTAFGFVQLFVFENIVSIFIAAGCAGYGLTSVMPTAIFNVSVAVKQSLSATAIAIINCAANVGMFLSPFIITFILKFISNGTIKTQFIIGAIGLMAIAILYILGNMKISKTVTQSSS